MSKSTIVLRDLATFHEIVRAFPSAFPWSEAEFVSKGYNRKALPFVRLPLWRKADVCQFLSKRYSSELVAKFAKAIGLEPESTPTRRKHK
jgi:hypothetical protein